MLRLSTERCCCCAVRAARALSPAGGAAASTSRLHTASARSLSPLRQQWQAQQLPGGREGTQTTASARLRVPSSSRRWATAAAAKRDAREVGENEEQDPIVQAALAVLRKAASADGVAAGEQQLSNKDRRTVEDVEKALAALREAQETVASLEHMSRNETDADLRELAKGDLDDAHTALSDTRDALTRVLAPPSQLDERGAFLEIKAGVGGGEAGLFAAELVRMLRRHAARHSLASELVEVSGNGVGALANSDKGAGLADAQVKEAIIEVKGEGAYGKLRHEAGVHRVQRVPATESSGRVHTSTATVVVLPAAAEDGDAIGSDQLYDLKDVKIEVMRSRGAGGQHVNRTESAVRLTHAPTGITVSMQDSRSQHENRTKAFRVLSARLLDLRLASERASARAARTAQVRASDRSEKARTYNFPQGRVTDHRAGVTLAALEDVLDGGEALDLLQAVLDKNDRHDRLQVVAQTGEISEQQ